MTMFWGAIQPLAAQSKMDSIFQKTLSYAQKYTPEKVYLHFDNTSYYLGETLWFKAYVTASERHVPTPLSEIVYVELWNQYGQRIERQILQLEEGAANGQFILDKKMLPGYYEVRAYTRWMRNFGDLNTFSRIFPFYTAAIKGDYKKELFHFRLNEQMQERPEKKQKAFSVEFYPEGGELVQGIPSQVAFRVSAKDNPYPAVKMSIHTASGDSIGSCVTLHDGMGRFTYRPRGKAGHVRIHYRDKDYRFTLPEARLQGFCLGIRAKQNDSIELDIRSNSWNTDTLGVTLAAGGRLYQAVAVMLDGNEHTLRLPLSGLPAGVAQAVLYSGKGEPVCERMFFVHRSDDCVRMSVGTQKSIYAPGEAVKLDFQLQEANGRPVATSFSLAVRDVLSSDVDLYDDNLRTNLLLSSELKGYIHRPEYYFHTDGTVRAAELDLLLMVQGWRKYNWTQMVASTVHIPYGLPERKLVLEGELKSMLTRKVMRNVEVSIAVKDSSLIFGSTTTDSMGKFRIPLDGFRGRRNAILQSRRKASKQKTLCYFLLNRHFSPPLRAYEPEELLSQPHSLSDSIFSQITEAREIDMKRLYGTTILLDEVSVGGRRKEYPTLVYDQSIDVFYDVEQIVEDDLDKGIQYLSLTDFLEKKNTFFKTNSIQSGYKGQGFYVVLNGVLSRDAMMNDWIMKEVEGIKSLMICDGPGVEKFLSTLAAASGGDVTDATNATSQIESGQVDRSFTDTEENSSVSETTDAGFINDAVQSQANSQMIGSSIRTNNVIFFVTTLPDIDIDKRHRSARGTRATYVQGYNESHTFYSPDYSVDALPVDHDHRRTLYWNSDVCTDLEGKTVVQFYNAANYTRLNISAETVTSQGKVGSLNICK